MCSVKERGTLSCIVRWHPVEGKETGSLRGEEVGEGEGEEEGRKIRATRGSRARGQRAKAEGEPMRMRARLVD